MATYEEKRLSVDALRLDLANPRMPDDEFDDETGALAYLVEQGSLEELIDSIANSGWLDFEPMIVLEDTNEVIEGNRRLAALRLLRDPDLAGSLGVKIPADMHPNSRPDEVRAWVVERRQDARDFIGFKHINGPFKWDSFAKAKYAAEWLDEQPDIQAVSKRLGDTHRTVERLVNGYTVLRQAELLGFERKEIPGRFNFSHLYTGLTRPAIRDYVGLPNEQGLLAKNPVESSHTDNLHQLMVWLYGQRDVDPVVRRQNPDLKRLAEVLSNRTATAMLSRTGQLSASHAMVEDKPSRFESDLLDLAHRASNVSGAIGDYDGSEELLAVAEGLVKTVRAISSAMASAAADAAEER